MIFDFLKDWLGCSDRRESDPPLMMPRTDVPTGGTLIEGKSAGDIRQDNEPDCVFDLDAPQK